MEPAQSLHFQQILAQDNQAFTPSERLAVLRAYDHFLRQYPDAVAGYQNRSALLQQLGLYQLAWQDAQKVEALAPDFALGHCNKAFLLNLLGDYEKGWAEYEWRWRTDVETFANKGWPIPHWQGEPLPKGKKLLVYAEQGFGDNIQFVRFAIAAKQQGLPVVVVNHQPLERLLNHNLHRYGVETAPNGSAIGDLASYVSMMSLPHRLGTTLHTLPYPTAYLDAEPAFFAKWQQKLTACREPSAPKRLKVGIVWAGSAKHHRDQLRSLQCQELQPLFACNAEFHCLQKVIAEADLATIPQWDNLRTWQDHLHDFSETAGLIAQLDLVISVDTSVAHLAAAMGKPTWILLSFHPDFRWLLERQDSPWYHSVRLFRQHADCLWQPVIEQVSQQLHCVIGKLNEQQ